MAVDSETQFHEPPDRFRFPSLTVDDTVASAASSSISMAPVTPPDTPLGRSHEPTSNPLEDSAYDWVAESSDDEHADSLVSVDPLDTVSIPESDETDSDVESEIPSFHQAMVDTSAISSTGNGNEDTVLDNSGMTARPEDPAPFPDLRPEVANVEDSSIRGYIKDYGFPVHLEGQKSTQPLPLANPFRVLFVPCGASQENSADINSYAKDIIVQKLSEALVINQRLTDVRHVRSRNSKYHAFPTSGFGDPKASPSVELLPGGGVEIDLEQLTGLHFDQYNGRPRLTGFYLDENSTPLVLPKAGEKPMSKRWDLAVLYRHNSDANSMAYVNMKRTMWRCNVPTLDLADGGDSTLRASDTSNSICLVDSSGVIPGIRYGLPLYMFAEFDAKELSMHLLHLISDPWSEPHPFNRSEEDLSPMKRSKLPSLCSAKALRTWIQDHPMASIAALVHLLAFLAVLTSFAVSEFLPSAMEVVDVQVTSTVPVGTPAVVQTTALTTKSIDSALGLPLTNSFAPAENRPSEFQSHRLGDSTVLLIPPKQFATAKRAPTLYVKVTRGSNPETLHHDVKLVDGMYAVELAREDAWGMIKVEIWTKSRPYVQQTFDMDFGGRWPDFGALSTFVREVSNTTVTSLSHVYENVETGLQLFSHDFMDLANGRAEQMKTKWDQIVKNGAAAYDETVKALVKTEKTACSLVRDTSSVTRDLFRKAKRNGKGIVGRVTGQRMKGGRGGKKTKKWHGS
jgi:hypothetical protein